ncbi:cupredoxin domain-containing protein [Kitasatospora aureofaciens]|uniref:cupredoxin domain-containing protein n=1 Tax=Kitasatospora aureofaciens TaxID=1894 RepID=UPI0038239FC7
MQRWVPLMRPPARLTRAGGALLLAAGLSGCLSGCLSAYVGPGPAESSSAAPPSSAAPRPTATTASAAGTVMISDFLFQPANFTVHPGAAVTVVNAGTVEHTLTAQDRSFDTGPIAPGTSATFTAPTQPGAYSYLCTFHHFMRGILTVAQRPSSAP